MTLNEMINHLEHLSREELDLLREAINRRATASDLRVGTMDVDTLLNAAAELTADLSDVEIREMIAAMNEEIIEPGDDELWRD